MPKFMDAAERAAALLAKYEGAASPPTLVMDGEPCAALHCWADAAAEADAQQQPIVASEVEAYNYDFQVGLLANATTCM
jgi:hypothetical protein